MKKIKKNNIMIGTLLLLIYFPWVLVSMAYIENSNWLTHIGVCAIVTLIGLATTQYGKNKNDK